MEAPRQKDQRPWLSALPADCKNVRDIADAAIWTVSSCKLGYGIDQLLDRNPDTYWQSDGPQPHIVNVQFHRKTAVCFVGVYVDFKADESYTPHKLAVRAGSHQEDLRELIVRQLDEPTGWQLLDVRAATGRPLRAFMLQLAVLANHQNGRDTHLRQAAVLAPTDDSPFGNAPFALVR